MKYYFYILLFAVIMSGIIYAQDDIVCPTILPDTISITTSTGVESLAVVLIDFREGRKQPGNIIPTADSDTIYFVTNTALNAIGGMGYEKVNGAFKKRIRKYTYDNYWDWVFDSTYTGNSHPDSATHNILSFGSLKDYYSEVSNNKLNIVPAQTRSGTSSKYTRGIVNAYDTASGKKYVRWIMMPQARSAYHSNGPTSEIVSVLDSLYSAGIISFDINSYQGKILIIAAGGSPGGITDLGGKILCVREKSYRNDDSRSVLDGIWVMAHEYGHTLNLEHLASSTYDPMNETFRENWGLHLYSPPHFNPISKLQKGWLNDDTIKISSTRSISLPAITSSIKKVGIVTIYGDAGRFGVWNHSDFLALEYRRREKFNRFSGGINGDFGSDSGGVLVWHYANGRITLTVANEDNFFSDHGNPTHFYYSGHDSIGPTTIPNTNSRANLTSGIKISNITLSNNQMTANVAYTLGSVPKWDMFFINYPYFPNLALSGNVYINDVIGGSNVTIADGTNVVFAQNASLAANSKLTSIGSSSNSIVYKPDGYSSALVSWKGLEISSTTNDTSRIINCLIKGAVNGVIISYPTVQQQVNNNTFQNCNTDILIRAGNYSQIFPNVNSNTLSKIKIGAANPWIFGVNQSLVVPNNAIVEINPNVKFQMSSGANIYSYGKILANGLQSQPIRFFSTTDAPNSWGNITFDGNGTDYSDLSNCKIERGGEVQCLNGADVIIDSVTFRKMNRAVYFNNSAPWILNCNIDSVSLSAIEGNSNYQGVSVYSDSIKRGYSTKQYKGIYFNATNGNIINNKVQGFSQGMYFKSGSNPLFNKGDGTNPNPNNKIKWNSTGIHVRDESYPDIGDLDAVEGNNMIDSNTTYNIVAELGSYVMAENNYFGCGNPYNIYDEDSYISTEAILITNPFTGASCASSASKIEEAMTIAPILTESARLIKKQFKEGLTLKSGNKSIQAFNHFKLMYLQNKLPKASLSQITSLYNDTLDFGVYDFLNDQISLGNGHKKTLLLHIARLNYRRGDIDLVKQQLNRVISNYPKTEEAVNAEFERFYVALHNEKNKDLATRYLSELEAKYSEQDVAGPKYLLQTARFDISDIETNHSIQMRVPMKKQNSEISSKTPLQFDLSSNYPNPFNPHTTISFTIPNAAMVTLTVYDNLGRIVSELVNSVKTEGKYEVMFDASKYSSGVYYYKLIAGKDNAVRRMLLLK